MKTRCELANIEQESLKRQEAINCNEITRLFVERYPELPGLLSADKIQWRVIQKSLRYAHEGFHVLLQKKNEGRSPKTAVLPISQSDGRVMLGQHGAYGDWPLDDVVIWIANELQLLE